RSKRDWSSDVCSSDLGISKLLLVLSDGSKSTIDFFLINPAMHALRHHVFIVRPVKGSDLTWQRVMFADPPQKVVFELFLSGFSKTRSRGSLRVKDRKHRLDSAT